MHHSLKIKILDLDHIESIVEQDITDVEAEKIVGGTLSVSAFQVVPKKIVGGTLSVSASQVIDLVASPAEPIPIPPLPSWHLQPISLLHGASLQLQTDLLGKADLQL